MLRCLLFFLVFLSISDLGICKLPEITPQQTVAKLHEIMKAHASHKTLTPELVQRTLQNYLDELDPAKSYFIETDIHQWLEPSDALLKKILDEFNKGNFSAFYAINDVMVKAIHRRREIEKKIDYKNLPKKVDPDEFKKMKWTTDEAQLVDRITRIKALQMESAAKLSEDLREKSLQRIAKRQLKTEDDFLNTDPRFHQQLVLSEILKAATASLDAHTAYFTPDEATQFMINVQQKLYGIGAQLRDDINGFTVVKIIEGSPAAQGKKLKVKDRVIAVNGEPVVGMDIIDAVDLIRGEENTPVVLTVIREVEEGDQKKEEKIDISIPRGEVVLKESRFESSYEPFGDGVIGYLRLYSFYQDQDSSSSDDLAKAIEKLKKEHQLKGIILDLRYNSGGLLSQAVGVAGLFITKGTVASIKDDTGNVQHLRALEGKTAWMGPLIVLVNRASASASEIVAGTLQDYGRAIIVGDDHSYGKGSFQTFTLNTTKNETVNPQGEYKVTRGRYYTVSGKTPQLTGVLSDIIVPGALSEMEIGEGFAKYPLEGDKIKENFDDDLSDVPYFQREKVKALYKFDLQQKLDTYVPYMEALKANSKERIAHNKNYQNYLKEIKKKDKELLEEEEGEHFGQSDLQLIEANNILKDLIFMEQMKSKTGIGSYITP